MGATTYFRWIIHPASREPDWASGEAHIRALPLERIRDRAGECHEWTLIDEVLALPETADDPTAELAAVRVQLAADLHDLRLCWMGGRNDATNILHRGHRTLLSGGWPGGDDQYPTDFTGCIARLVGSGTARAAGFTVDD